MKRHLPAALTLFLSLTGCKTTPTPPLAAHPPQADRAPASALVPPWILRGLGGDFTIKGEPEEACLQRYIDKTSSYRNAKSDPEPFLAKRIIDVSKAMKLDPYIFAGLIQQETGDFTSHRGNNGVGLTQMTNVAIRDACLALEGTGCPRPQANPEYLDLWENLFKSGVKALHTYDNDYQYYYPWRSQCFLYEHRCEANCGIDNSCIKKIRDKIYESYTSSLLMGAFTLANKLAEAKANKRSLVGVELYRSALKLYNGHPRHQVKYANKIIGKHVPAILAACPAIDIKENH